MDVLDSLGGHELNSESKHRQCDQQNQRNAKAAKSFWKTCFNSKTATCIFTTIIIIINV